MPSDTFLNSLVNRLTRKIRRINQVKILLTLYNFIVHRERFLDNVLHKRWFNYVHPFSFFAIFYSLAMILYSFIPYMSKEVKWHEVWSTLDNHNANIFIEELLLPKDNLQQSMKVESIFPGRSDASRHIRNIVGSDTASSVAYYLASRDANLSKLILTKAKRIEKYKKSFLWLQRLLRPCLIFVSCVPIHFLFQARGRTVRQTVHVFLYYEGLWSVLEAAYINLGQFVPLSSIPLESLYIFNTYANYEKLKEGGET